MIKKIVFALIICSGIRLITGAGAVLYAQHIDRSDMSVSGIDVVGVGAHARYHIKENRIQKSVICHHTNMKGDSNPI